MVHRTVVVRGVTTISLTLTGIVLWAVISKVGKGIAKDRSVALE